MEKLKSLNKFILVCCWILVIGSVFGFFAEMLYSLVYSRTFQIRKGLIYGPFIQIYGMGALAYYFLVKYEQDPKRVFFKGMLMGGILEYVCSFLQEIFFNSISWDYSNNFINFNGRTCLQYCIYWGIIGVFFLKAVYPLILKGEKLLDKKYIRVISYIVILFAIYDVTITSMATGRQLARQQGIPPQGVVDEYLDRKYPDELLDKVYNNKKMMESE